MIDPSKITLEHAGAIFADHDTEHQSSDVFDGQMLDWWTDGRSAVWFYEPGHDGEDTIARFAFDYSAWREQ